MVESGNAIIPANLNARAVAELALSMSMSIVEIRRTVLHDGVDYGKIPGTNKDVLLKPGAEKLSSAFKLYPVPKLLTCVEDWGGGFFFYRYQIDMVHRETGEIWGSGIGSCNSREKKYNWRWVNEDELPAGMDTTGLMKQSGMRTLTEFDFAVSKAETTGQYAKTAEHWQQFKDAIAAGKAKKVMKETKKGPSVAWEITTGSTQYRIANPEICDLVNTIDKMAFKRGLVAAVLIATNASEFFTQDMEDFMSLALPDEDDNVIEGQMEDVTPPAAPVVEEKKPEPKWHTVEANMHELSERAFTSGYTKERNGKGVAELVTMLEPKTWANFETGKDAWIAIKEIAEARKAAKAAKAAAKIKTPEPEITDPAALALVNGQVKPGESPFKTDSVGDAIRSGTPEDEDGKRILTEEELDEQLAIAEQLDKSGAALPMAGGG